MDWNMWSIIITIIATGVAAVLAIIGANIALFSWLRTDMKSFETEIRGWKQEINKEMKDFHLILTRQDMRIKAKREKK